MADSTGGLAADAKTIRDDHPIFHADPSRATAFADLLLNPVGNYREWARRWSWTLARVQRFIIALEREGLIKCRRSRWGTTVCPIRSRYGADTEDGGPPDTEPSGKQYGADSEPIHLGSLGRNTSLGTRPSSRSQQEPQQPPDNYTAVCIDTMNEQLERIVGAEFKHVMHDNRRSALAVDRWRSAGIPMDFAVEEIRKGCLKFNPSKHGRGKPPGTLGYFEKGVLAAHETRSQMAITLPPVVQRGGAGKREEPPTSSQESGEQPTALAATISNVMDGVRRELKTPASRSQLRRVAR